MKPLAAFICVLKDILLGVEYNLHHSPYMAKALKGPNKSSHKIPAPSTDPEIVAVQKLHDTGQGWTLPSVS